jgi:hypothetical protein
MKWLLVLDFFEVLKIFFRGDFGRKQWDWECRVSRFECYTVYCCGYTFPDACVQMHFVSLHTCTQLLMDAFESTKLYACGINRFPSIASITSFVITHSRD